MLQLGRKDRSLMAGEVIDRDLGIDLARLHSHFSCSTIVTLNETHELEEMGISDILEKIRELGMESVFFQIRDMGVPAAGATREFVSLVEGIVGKVKAGQRVVVHCKAGKGRTGLVVGCCLVHLGVASQKAIDLVRRSRPGTIQTWLQEKYIKGYSEMVRKLGENQRT